MRIEKRELPPVEPSGTLQKILDRHSDTASCDVVSAVLQINSQALPSAVYALLHNEKHLQSAVPELCSEGLRELVELLLACGIETGLRLAGEGQNTRWKN
jgi:hypothetical protein